MLRKPFKTILAAIILHMNIQPDEQDQKYGKTGSKTWGKQLVKISNTISLESLLLDLWDDNINKWKNLGVKLHHGNWLWNQ